MEVHRQLGRGFLEAVYQEAMAIELESRGILHGREVELPVFYKGQRLTCEYRADFVCFESVIVELKAVSELSGAHEAQVINYLKATGIEIGLLINFGGESLDFKRFIRSSSAQSAKSAEKKTNPQIAQISQMEEV
jgi:GxxExxY protein